MVSQRLHYQRRFYLRPKFRQLRRLLGPAYTKSATPKKTQLQNSRHGGGYTTGAKIATSGDHSDFAQQMKLDEANSGRFV